MKVAGGAAKNSMEAVEEQERFGRQNKFRLAWRELRSRKCETNRKQLAP